jgi:tight adherence protein C
MSIMLAAIAGVLLAFGVVDLATLVVEHRRAAAAQIDDAGRPARVTALLVRIGRRIGAPAAPGDLGARLAAAGLAPTITVADAMSIKAGAGVAAALLATPFVLAFPLRLALVALPASAAAGFLAPDLVLARRARRRAERATLELADALDLLRVAVAAGLPTQRALTEVGRRHRGLVADELRATADRLDLGLPHVAALAALERSLPLPAISQLAAAISRADRHGAPLTPALSALATESRASRARTLQNRAARAAPRIQLAIALLLVPAVLLIVAAGLVHSLT